MLKCSFALLCLMSFVGCLPPVEQGWRPDGTNADYGEYPSDYVQILRNWYLANLKDPDSAKFVAFSEPIKDNIIVNQFKKEAVFGYSVCALVNAKNSFGGYTGAQATWFLIHNGEIVRSQDAGEDVYIGHPASCSFK